jgi:hypothetical protein
MDIKNNIMFANDLENIQSFVTFVAQLTLLPQTELLEFFLLKIEKNYEFFKTQSLKFSKSIVRKIRNRKSSFS